MESQGTTALPRDTRAGARAACARRPPGAPKRRRSCGRLKAFVSSSEGLCGTFIEPCKEAVSAMKVFSFDPSEHRETFLSQGWLHIKNGVTPEFVEVMKEFVARELSEEQLKQFALAGKKGQGRFEFPPEVDF